MRNRSAETTLILLLLEEMSRCRNWRQGMKNNKGTRCFFGLLFLCLMAAKTAFADLRAIPVSADKAPAEFNELFEVKAANGNTDPVQFTFILKNNRKSEPLMLKGGKQGKELRGLVQTARVEIVRRDPYRTAVEFPLVFIDDHQHSQTATFKIEHDLLRDATAKIIVDGFGIVPPDSKLGFEPVMFEVDLKSFVKPSKN